MPIRLRFELWEYESGLTYRRASQIENERHRQFNGRLREVFYASSAADAAVQYYALRGMRISDPPETESREPFTRSELEAQFAEYPDDPALTAQISGGNAHPHPVEPSGHRRQARKRESGWIRRLLILLILAAVLTVGALYIWPDLLPAALPAAEMVPTPRAPSGSTPQPDRQAPA